MMRSAESELLYVGKAKNLKNRLRSYFQANLAPKTARMMAQVADIEILVTPGEKEALILECSLIKAQKPKYNVLLRDDKSYPYIWVSDDPFPRISAYRGTGRVKGKLFGPYPNVYAVRHAIEFSQKTYRVRGCENSFFRDRSRPCLMHQIDRCTAPCVGKINAEDYRASIHKVTALLEGKDPTLIADLVSKMQAAAKSEAFEKAAEIRDVIAALQSVSDQQVIEGSRQQSADILAIAQLDGRLAVQMMSVRMGKIESSQTHFVQNKLDDQPDTVLASFAKQWYLRVNQTPFFPGTLVFSDAIEEADLLAEALSERYERKVTCLVPTRGQYHQWVEVARQSAHEALKQQRSSSRLYQSRVTALEELFTVGPLERLVCFDVSHTQGEATQASAVVFDQNGPNKSLYRRFNIKTAQPGDDYQAMAEVVRRYLKNQESLPQFLIIDGGKGQLSAAEKGQAEWDGPWIPMLGVAKGRARKAGEETLWWVSQAGERNEIRLRADHPAFHLIQHIRDEAHRFAIAGHRKKRDKKRASSSLDAIPGVGPVLRERLLAYFGGFSGIQKASIEAIAKVPGISKRLAEVIYQAIR